LGETGLDRIICNIGTMNLKILVIANPMIRVSCHPNAADPIELPFGSERKAALQALNRQLKTGAGRNDQMKVIGH